MNLFSTVGVQAKEEIAAKALSHYILAEVFERLDRLNEAVNEYKAAIDEDPFSPQLRLNLAAALIKQNKLDKAIPELKRVISLASADEASRPEPITIESHTILALIYSLQGKIDEAADEYESALRGALASDPQNIRIHKSLGQIYLQQKRLAEARKTYEFMLNLSADDAEVYFYLGMIDEEEGRRQEAINNFKTALELNPEYPDALNSLGYLYAEESLNLGEAESMLEKALQYEPHNGAYLDSLAWTYYKQGRNQEAIQGLEEAVQFLLDPVIFEHLGDAYFKEGIINKAIENWEKSLQIKPENNSALKEKIQKHKEALQGGGGS
ncbi:MAG: tetratricopeptide repeat protein [Candidatus Omnitrophica bacterium]|nr:tetratricopeptide repeat protein [Candidatus Omnitrophota bacterium]MBU1871681.1 tetratricopeptide repeat protein [Candidatus Omnitrophota bacterium]